MYTIHINILKYVYLFKTCIHGISCHKAHAVCQMNKINTTLVYAKDVKVSAIIIYLVFCLSNLGLMGWTSWMLCYVGTSIISSTKFDSKIWVRSFNRDHSPHHTTVRSYIWYHHCIRQKHQQTSWSEKNKERLYSRDLEGYVVLSNILLKAVLIAAFTLQCFWRCWRNTITEMQDRKRPSFPSESQDCW